MMPGVHVENFGCRAARADGDAIGQRLHALSEEYPLAGDVVVVNTCSVTAEADRAARDYIRRTHRRSPSAKIVVTGCYAQRAPGELAAIPGVTAVVGNSHKALAPEIILGLSNSDRDSKTLPREIVPVQSILAGGSNTAIPIWADDRFAHSFLEEAQIAPGTHTRPNLKIQEGCGNRCTFCVIPLTRGPSKSLPYAMVMRKVEEFVAADGKELVLSGINLGRWGRDFAGSDKQSLANLVRAILERTSLSRLRLSSIEPMDWDEELIGLMRDFGGRFARHAHLPLQSGSDAVLRRMHRRYRPWHYAEKASLLRSAAGSDLTLGADVMVGFPGETEREFEETVAFLRELPFGYLHLFPFSPRPGTPGWALHASQAVAAGLVDERMRALRELAAEKTRAHRARFVGRELSVITLQAPAAVAARGCSIALSDNFLPLELDWQPPANQMLNVRVSGINAESELLASRCA